MKKTCGVCENSTILYIITLTPNHWYAFYVESTRGQFGGKLLPLTKRKKWQPEKWFVYLRYRALILQHIIIYNGEIWIS